MSSREIDGVLVMVASIPYDLKPDVVDQATSNNVMVDYPPS